MPTRSSTSVFLVLAAALLPLAVVAALESWGVSPSFRYGAAVAAAALLGAAGWRHQRRHARALLAIERELRAMAESAPAGGANHPASRGTPPVQDAMQALRTRVSLQLKEAAKKSRNLEAVIDAIDEPVLATDNTNAVLLCNRSAEVFLGGAPGTLKGRPITDLFTHADILDMHAAARAGEVRRLRVRLTTPVGPRVFQVSASPVPAAWGQGIFGAVLVLRDVTELDQAAAIKTDFVANASHELRTPVAAIRGAAETLEHCVRDDPTMATRFAGMIVQHAARLEEMLRDLLDLSRLESTDVSAVCREVNLAAFEHDLRTQFEAPAAERSIRLSFEFDDTLGTLHTDPNHLMLAVRNLLENAVKFAYERTTVRIVGTILGTAARSGGDSTEPGSALVPVTVTFEVIDRGVGIPLNLQDRVFERYFQVDSARTTLGTKRGTGLGLSIVKYAARSLGGVAGISSVWKEGTTAWIEFPAKVRRHAGEGTR
ncbi:MAG: sensor histidine kinase [Phycisphaerales bacterium]